MLNKLLVAIFFIFWGCNYSFCQTTFKSVEEIWKFADDHNVTILMAKYDLAKSRYSKNIAYSAFLPQFSTSFNWTDNTALQTTLIPADMFGGPAGVYRAVQFGQKYIYAAGFAAQLDLLNLQTVFNAKIARESEQLSRDSLANVKKNIYQQIATQYYSFLLMKEAAELATKSERIADSVVLSVSNKFKEGLTNEASLDVAKLNLLRAKQTSITAGFQMQTAKNNLKALLNLPLTDSLKIEDNLKISNEINLDIPFEEDPALRLANLQYHISLDQLKLTNTAFLPTISLAYNNATQQNDNKFEPFQSGPKWFPATYWSVKASWIIFNGGGRYFQSKKSNIAMEQKNLLFGISVNSSKINDENLKIAYQKAVALLNNTRNVMNLSLDNYKHLSNKYNAGIVSIDERLNAFSDYINYQNQYLNSLSDMLIQQYLVKIRQQSFQ